jgi:cytochrome c oxidase assembly factor CtaG
MSARSARLPRLVLLTWAIAVAALAVLAVAVAHYLSAGGGHDMHAMHGGGLDAADALSRAGADPFGPLLGSALVTKWQLNAIALAVLVLMAAWYLTAVALVPIRSPGTRWPLKRTVLFMLGLFVCGYATNGAIAVYDQVLFTAHMAGHLALVMLAPALLVAGRPLRLAIASSPPTRARRIAAIATGRVVTLLTAPPVALASYATVIVASHLTGLMNLIMRNGWVGQLEHLVYVIVGMQFFVLVVGDEPIRWRLSAPPRWVLLALSMAVDTFTGIVLMQGTVPIEVLSTPGVAVDALSDTRTGGAMMWFGGDAIMAVVMVALVIGWLRRIETHEVTGTGWLEQVRRANFTEVTGASTTDADAFDEGDAARKSYNDWLTRLESGH